MSAFIVCNEHINAMLQASGNRFRRYFGDTCSYYWRKEPRYIVPDNECIGQKLVNQNYRSVNTRYDENDEPHVFKVLTLREFSPVEIIKACDCYGYQCCETKDWKRTEAYAIMTALRERAIRALDGYEQAAWEINHDL